MSIAIQNIRKTFGNYRTLDDITLSVASGELMALLGPSGCGKTTLLRVIAGLETPDSGTILFHGEDATEKKPKDRKVGFVFQHYALFRHMNVFENVAFGLKVRSRTTRPSKRDIKERVMHLLNMVQMEWALERYPSELSGGQRQRIALARALVIEPKVLLLDEPFSALDAKVREELRRWLRRLHDELHVTSIFVTHDQEEALELADKIVIINEGRVEQTGTPESVYEHPVSSFVYNFLGRVNVFHGRITDGCASIGSTRITIHRGAEGLDAIEGLSELYVRPHDVDISHVRRDDEDIEAEIMDIRMTGPVIGLQLNCVGIEGRIEAEVSRQHYTNLGIGKTSRVFVKLKHVRFFSKDTYSI
ncbi:MAG: sulfate ABC transporter ATP-binding protein [Spirochaetes bacterium]|nr:sulfate ABC transporter ATP-binding protein [Spirochaetota bacterium]